MWLLNLNTPATDEDDFFPLFGLLQFAFIPPEPGVGYKDCFHVFIKDDEEYENTESFYVSLKLHTNTIESGVLLYPNLTKIFIVDDGMT